MRINAVLNREGGTLKTTDLDTYVVHLRDQFEQAGHDLSCSVVPASNIVEALTLAANSAECDVILAGGGDGTISAAAGIAWRADKAIGVIPAGTMNLFARSLAVPLNIHNAAGALALGRITQCDIATANGRPFVHQYSVGLQPRIVERRDALDHNSRVEKMIAGVRAAFGTFVRPPAFRVRLTLDGHRVEEKANLVTVSNNPFGEGHIPYADSLDNGVLGVYRAGLLSPSAAVKLATDLLIGSWSSNPDFRATTAREVLIEFPRKKRNVSAVIDGELVSLESAVEIKIHRGELKVLVPQDVAS